MNLAYDADVEDWVQRNLRLPTQNVLELKLKGWIANQPWQPGQQITYDNDELNLKIGVQADNYTPPSAWTAVRITGFPPVLVEWSLQANRHLQELVKQQEMPQIEFNVIREMDAKVREVGTKMGDTIFSKPGFGVLVVGEYIGEQQGRLVVHIQNVTEGPKE